MKFVSSSNAVIAQNIFADFDPSATARPIKQDSAQPTQPTQALPAADTMDKDFESEQKSKLIYGVIQVAVGGALTVVPEPTGLTKVGGGSMMANGMLDIYEVDSAVDNPTAAQKDEQEDVVQGVRLFAGVAQIGLGIALLAAPEPSGVTKVGGVLLIGNGLKGSFEATSALMENHDVDLFDWS